VIGLLPKGSKYDLFRGAAPVETIEEEKVPASASKIIKVSLLPYPFCFHAAYFLSTNL
jgi:hypothetical protein